MVEDRILPLLCNMLVFQQLIYFLEEVNRNILLVIHTHAARSVFLCVCLYIVVFVCSCFFCMKLITDLSKKKELNWVL